MPFGIIGWTGPGMRQVLGLGIGKQNEYFWGGANLGRAIVTNGDLTACVCDSASIVGAAVSGGACGGPRHCCIWWGVHVVQGEGGFWAFCFPFSQWEMSLDRRRWNVSHSYAKNWQHFRSANVSMESSIRGRFGDILSFQIKVVIYEKLEKSYACSTKTYAAPLAVTSSFRTGLRLALAMCAGLAREFYILSI